MKIKIRNIAQNIKFQFFVALTAALFLYKLFVTQGSSLPLLLINEILVILTATSLVIYTMDFIKYKNVNPLSLVMNVGIISAVIFFMISFSDFILNTLFENLGERITNSDLVYTIVSFFYVFIILASISYIFFAFKELYFFKQKRDIKTYFKTMVIFFLLASITKVLNIYEELSYINNTFLIISILLIVINSIRISWIAFIVKKEKVILLVLSVVISVLFVVNLVNSSTETTHSQVISGFSPALNQFFTIIMIYGVIYFSVLFFTTLFHIPTAEAFDRKAQEVSSLQYFSKLITQVLDFNELAETVTDISTKVVNADAAWIALKENNELKPIANKNIGYLDAELLTKFVSNKINEPGFDNQVIYLENFIDRSRLSENFSSIIVSPLQTHNEIKGYLLAAKKENIYFDDEDKNAIKTFSDYASVAIENSRLLEESIEKERLEKELDLAREIQRKIIPSKNPVLEKLNISSVFIPAFEVGGDYYDFFQINNDNFGFIIADVSGKGISAAFIMAEIKGIFQSLSRTFTSPKEILVNANQILKGTLDRKSFISAAYGVINLKEEVLSISRAGHCPVLLLRDGKTIRILPKGIGLGLNYSDYFAETLEEIKIDLKDNDTLVLYTDGITESKNYNLEDFGEKNFEKILLNNVNNSAEQISNKVIQDVTLFSNSGSQHDDITLVIFKWKQKIKNGDKEWQTSIPQSKTTVI